MTGGGDGRSAALRASEVGVRGWRDAVLAQRVAGLDHADFYGLAADVSDTLTTVGELLEVLAGQVDRYPASLPAGRQVYDDSYSVDPAVRLATAAGELRAAAGPLDQARGHLDRFWSAIGHIGVEDAR